MGWELILSQSLPWILGGGLASLLKVGDKTLGQKLIAAAIGIFAPKPTIVPVTPGTPVLPPQIAQILGPFLDKLLTKPPVAPSDPKTPIVVPTDPVDLIKLLTDLVSKPEVTPPVSPIDAKPNAPTPTQHDHKADASHVIACATAYHESHPDDDLSVSIDAAGVRFQNVKRANAEPK